MTHKHINTGEIPVLPWQTITKLRKVDLPFVARVALYITGLLRSSQSLESFTALTAVIWGLAVTVSYGFWNIQLKPPLVPVKLFEDYPFLLGFPITFLGIVSTAALISRRKKLRSYSSLASFMYWGALSFCFVVYSRPLPGAIIMYGMMAFAELWVYVRVDLGQDRPDDE